ncbi:MAG: hypothetical protein ABIA04_00640 [Pseudomonadota bacterium]
MKFCIKITLFLLLPFYLYANGLLLLLNNEESCSSSNLDNPFGSSSNLQDTSEQFEIGCGLVDGLIEYYSFDLDKRTSYEDSMYVKTDPNYDTADTDFTFYFHNGCSIGVSDHTHTWHTEEYGEMVDLENHNEYIEDNSRCPSGECYYLNGFTDPLKIMHDVNGNTGNSLKLGDSASFFAWISLDTETRILNNLQTIIRGGSFSFIAALEQDENSNILPSFRPGLDLGSIEGCGLNINTDAYYSFEKNTFQFVGISVKAISENILEVSFFLNGELIENRQEDISLINDNEACSPVFKEDYVASLESLGDHYYGIIDEIMIFNKDFDETGVKKIYDFYLEN